MLTEPLARGRSLLPQALRPARRYGSTGELSQSVSSGRSVPHRTTADCVCCTRPAFEPRSRGLRAICWPTPRRNKDIGQDLVGYNTGTLSFRDRTSLTPDSNLNFRHTFTQSSERLTEEDSDSR